MMMVRNRLTVLKLGGDLVLMSDGPAARAPISHDLACIQLARHTTVHGQKYNTRSRISNITIA